MRGNWKLAGVGAVVCVSLGGGAVSPALAKAEVAPGTYVPQTDAGAAVAQFDAAAASYSEAWIDVPVDSDADGVNDKIFARIQVPPNASPTSKVPVVVSMSPYYGGIYAVPQHDPKRELWDPSQPKPAGTFGTWDRPGDSDSPSYDNDGAYWLERGFAFARVATLGTSQSTGCPQMLNRTEADATKSVVDWLAGTASVTAHDAAGALVSTTSWSSGSVGMTGTSYDGALPLLASTTGAAGLKAIAPMAPVSNFYDYYRVGGGLYGPEGYAGEDLDNYVLALRPRGDDRCTAVAQQFAEAEDRTTGDYSPFWAERNLLNYVGQVTTPTLIGHGLNDRNVRVGQSTEWYEALRAKGVPAKLYLHQGGHMDVAWAAGSNWQANLNRWFTHYLFGVENDVETEPAARYQLADRSTWVDEPAWPAADAGAVSFFTAAGGQALGTLQPGTRNGLVGVESLADDASLSLQNLTDSDTSPNRLLYQTAPLSTELRISGTPTAQLALSFNRPAANVSAAVVDIDPAGTRTLISRAWIDPQNRSSISETEAVTPGTSYDLPLQFVPTEYRVPAGHTIALLVASSDTETSLLPAAGTTLTLDTSASSFALPIVGASAATQAALGTFTIPTLTTATPTVNIGERQTLTGAGFAPEAPINLRVDSETTPITVTTDVNGAFTTSLPIDSNIPVGQRSVVASAGRADLATATFTVQERPVVVTPPTGTEPGTPGANTPDGSDGSNAGSKPRGDLANTGTAPLTATLFAAAIIMLGASALLLRRKEPTSR